MLPPDPAPSPLTPQQRAIIACVADGLTTRGIADRLGWDMDAILLHLAGAIGTLRARSVPDAVARAIELGILDPPGERSERAAG